MLMKKLITLLILFVGMVSSVSAWDTVYLNDDDNSWGSGSPQPFKMDNSNHHTYTFNATKLLKIRQSDYFFRFYVSNGGGHFQPTNDRDVISSTDYKNCISGESNAFQILKAPNAKSLVIDLNYNDSDGDWKWHLTATITNYDNTTKVCYVDDATAGTSLGAKIYAYAWDPNNDNLRILGNFPGTEMNTNSDGTFYLDGISYAEGMKIIFNNKEDGSNGSQTSDIDLTANSVYTFSGKVENRPVTVSSYSNGTFSSIYPLDFTSVDGLTAYRIDGASGGTLSTASVGKVPANTGLYVEGSTAGKEYSVPTTVAAVSVGTNWLKPGTGATVPQTDGVGNTNFILTTNKGASATPKFFKVSSAGNTVAAGKAYLQIPSKNVGAHEYFWFEDETTGIEAAKASQKMNGEFFNLAGQRVAQPTKGLYVVNGKKVIMK